MGPEGPTSTKRSKRVLAGFCSALIPGVGQIVLGRTGVGAIWLACAATLISANLVLRPWTSWALVVFMVWIALILNTAAAYNAAFSRRDGRVSWVLRLWLLPFFVVAVGSSVYLVQHLWTLTGYKSFSVPSTAMELTILPGEKIVSDTHAYAHSEPRRNDIVVYLKDDTWFVKRVIAIAGDVIEGRNGDVFLNGAKLDEPFVVHRAAPVPASQRTFGPVVVPKGSVFVMGDNRDVSLDSRVNGPVPISLIRGRVLYNVDAERHGRKEWMQTH